MIRDKLLGLSVLVALVLSMGCSNPKEPLDKYLDAYLHGRDEEAYSYISQKDKAVKSLEEFKGGRENDTSPLTQMLINRISYQIKEIKVEGKMANAKVETTMPDFSILMKDLMGAAFASAFADKKGEKEIYKMLEDKYRDNLLPMTTVEENYRLVKEDDGWKVFFDWETEKKIKEKTAEAEKLEKSKDYAGAKAAYDQIIQLDPKHEEAGKKSKEMEEKIALQKIKDEYLPKVSVMNPHIGESFFGEKGVFGEIKNEGERILNMVEITIYFLDKESKPIYETTYQPVRVSEFSFGDAASPLKPGYSRKFGVKADDAPSAWAGKVSVKVTDLEFGE